MLIIVTRPAGWFMPSARVRISSARALNRFMSLGMTGLALLDDVEHNTTRNHQRAEDDRV